MAAVREDVQLGGHAGPPQRQKNRSEFSTGTAVSSAVWKRKVGGVAA